MEPREKMDDHRAVVKGNRNLCLLWLYFQAYRMELWMSSGFQPGWKTAGDPAHLQETWSFGGRFRMTHLESRSVLFNPVTISHMWFWSYCKIPCKSIKSNQHQIWKTFHFWGGKAVKYLFHDFYTQHTLTFFNLLGSDYLLLKCFSPDSFVLQKYA